MASIYSTAAYAMKSRSFRDWLLFAVLTPSFSLPGEEGNIDGAQELMAKLERLSAEKDSIVVSCALFPIALYRSSTHTFSDIHLDFYYLESAIGTEEGIAGQDR